MDTDSDGDSTVGDFEPVATRKHRNTIIYSKGALVRVYDDCDDVGEEKGKVG